MYRPNSFKHLSHHTLVRRYERNDCCDRCIGRRNNTATRFFVINKTRLLRSLHRSSKQHSDQVLRDQQNFRNHKQTFTPTSPNLYYYSLVKHLSSYTGRISHWMAFALSVFAHRKQITERCSLRDAFSGNAALANVYKWRHSDIIVIKLTVSHLVIRIKFPTRSIFRNFHI